MNKVQANPRNVSRPGAFFWSSWRQNIIYLGFISLGLPDGTFGVAWPALHRDLRLPIGFAGIFVVIGTLLSAFSGFNSGRVIGRFRTGPVVLVSCALTGLAALITACAQNFTWLVLAVVPLGLGAGAVDAGLNGYVARHYRARHMNWLHACWGVGATCGPLLMAHALGSGAGWRAGYLWIAAAQLSLAVVFLLTLRLWALVPERSAHDAALELNLPTIPTTPANSTAGWLSAGIFSLYVAVEGTSGIWAASILVESRGFTPESAGRCAAAFYGAITLGRIFVGFIVEPLGNRRVIAAGIALAFAGAALFAFAHTPALAAGALVVLGLGFAPVYPCLMHEVPRRFAPDAVQTVIGRQSGAASLGAAFLPSAAGWLAQVSLESIVWTVFAGIVALALAVRRLNRLTSNLAPASYPAPTPPGR